MPGPYPTDAQRRTLWSALTGVAIVILGALAVGLIYLMGNVLSYLQPVLVPLAVAGILAYLVNPVVHLLENKGLSRLRAIIYVFVLSALGLALLATFAVPRIVEQSGRFIEDYDEIGNNLYRNLRTTPWLRPALNYAFGQHEKFQAHPPGEVIPSPVPADPADFPVWFEGTSFGDWVKGFPDWIPGRIQAENRIPKGQTRFDVWLKENRDAILDTTTSWLKGGANKVFGLVGYALGFFLVPVYLFFFLKESATIKRRWSHFVPLKESNFKNEVVETVNEMNDYLIAFFRGQVLVSIIDGVLTGLLLWMIGLPYAFVIGIALAILGVMPFVGFLLTLIPALIIASATWGDWQHPLLVLAIFFVVQQVDGLLIQPKIIGDKVGLHPMTIIFSIFFWSLILGGFLGALLAIPLTASVKVLFTRYVWNPSSLDQAGEPPPENRDPSGNEAPAS